MNASNQLPMTVLASLFAALIAAGAYMAIPIGPVPIVLQNFFVLLTGLVLGRRWGLMAVGVYLLAGALGLPVFAGGSGGIGRFLGPTGGYLLGYLPAVWVTGLISEKTKSSALGDIIAMVSAAAVIYGLGVSWLKFSTAMDVAKALAVGMFPFLLGDAIKIAAAVPVARAIRPLIARYRSDARQTGALAEGQVPE